MKQCPKDIYTTFSSNENIIFNKNTSFLVLLAMNFFVLMYAFDQIGIGVMLPIIQKDFDMFNITQQWIVNIYLLFMACFILISGKLADKWGRSKIFEAGVFLFFLGSIGCGFAPNSIVLLLSRAIQGVGAALAIPLTFAFVNHCRFKENQESYLGVFVGITTVYFIVAPYICGFISQNFGWRYVFLLNIPLSLICILISIKFLHKKDKLNISSSKLNYLSAIILIIMISLGILSLNYLSYGKCSVMLFLLLLCFLLSIFSFLRQEKKNNFSLIDLKLLSNKNFIGCLIIAFCIQGIINISILCGIFLQTNLGFSAKKAGIIFVLSTIPSILTPFFSNKLVSIWGTKRYLQAGFIILCVGILFIIFSAAFHNIPFIVLGLLAYSCAITPLLSVVVKQSLMITPPEKQGFASALVYQARQLGAPVSMIIMGAIAYHGVERYGLMTNKMFSLSMLVAIFLILLSWLVIQKCLP